MALNEEPPLKAVVLADFCGGSPIPYSSTAAAQALPLNGSPVLHWQLLSLSRGGVADALVLSSAPLERPLPSTLGSMKISTLHNPSWRSPGDALRDVESRVSLRPTHDFLLVQPGAVFNLHALSLARAHAARAAADRNWLVTVVFRRAAAATPLTIATAGTGALCLYARGPRAAHPIVLDTRAENVGLLARGEVRIVADVVDVGLDVCSPDLLVEFRENFDFDHVRDYVRAKLDGGEAELLGNRMFVHYIDSEAGEYASSVDSFAGLMSTTQDVFDGWMLPISPVKVARVCESAEPGQVVAWDACKEVAPGVLQCFAGGISNGLAHGGEYQVDRDVSNVVIGRRAVIEHGAVVRRCVLGEGARISSGAVLENCIICAECSVGKNAELSKSILMKTSTVADDVKVPRYCFLDEGVSIGNGGGLAGGLKPSTWIMACRGKKKWRRRTELHSDNESATESDETSTSSEDGGDVEDERSSDLLSSDDALGLGDEGNGYVLKGARCPEYFLERIGLGERPSAGWPAFLDVSDSDEDDELEGAEPQDVLGNEAAGSAMDIEIGADATESDDATKKQRQFFDEVAETIEHSISNDQDIDIETIALEVNSLKLGYIQTYSDARVAVVRGLVALAQQQNPDGAGFEAISGTFAKWGGLVQKFSANDNAASQRALLNELAVYLSDNAKLLACALKCLFDQDHLEEEAILEWAADEREAPRTGNARSDILEQPDMKRFLEWLEEDDDEDDDEDEE